MNNAIEIKGLHKQYDDFCLKNISLDIPMGSVVGLIGENGAGKSTLIQAMLGIVASQYEMINILGKSFPEQEKMIKEEIAVIYDNCQYDLNFNPLFIGKILSKIYQNWHQDTYLSYLKQFNLSPKKKLKEFSKGMKMKLEFAIAFSHEPKLLILDEATSGLDPVFRDEILDLLREFSEDENHTVLISSHITSDLDKIADYIAYLHQGQLMFVKPYATIQDDYGVLNCKKAFLDNLSKDDVVAYRQGEYSYQVLVKNKFALQRVFKDLVIEKATIEDIMLYYAKGEQF